MKYSSLYLIGLAVIIIIIMKVQTETLYSEKLTSRTGVLGKYSKGKQLGKVKHCSFREDLQSVMSLQIYIQAKFWQQKLWRKRA